jgi:hypothetical protein
MISLRVPGILKLAAIMLILAVGLIHLLFVQGSPTYLGVLFAAIVSAWGIYWNVLWGWVLGVLVAGGAFVGYIVSRTAGLPGFEMAVGMWGFPPGTLSLVLETLFVAVFVVAVVRDWR